MSDPIHRLPPYTFHHLVAGSALSEQIDWGLKALNAPEFWKLTAGFSKRKNKAVKVAVCDTGVDANHKDLKDRLKVAKDFTGSTSGAKDIAGHGTHCCGIVCASKNDSGIIGVAHEVELSSYKVLGDDGSGASTWIARGIDAAVADGNHVISMSLGSAYRDSRIMRAIELGTKAGAVFICAAGNDGTDNSVNWPGRSELVVAVASYNKQGRISNYSSRGPEVDIAAPGEQILSTMPQGAYGVMSGTSMATPFIAGVVALMIAREWDMTNPVTPIFVEGDASNNYDRVLKHLKRHAVDYGEPGHDPSAGWGFVDPQSLLKAQEEAPIVVPPPVMHFELEAVLNGQKGKLVFVPTSS